MDPERAPAPRRAKDGATVRRQPAAPVAEPHARAALTSSKDRASSSSTVYLVLLVLAAVAFAAWRWIRLQHLGH
jgi:hypothetical protein